MHYSLLANGRLLVASTSGDDLVLIWESEDSTMEKWILKQKVAVDSNIQHCVAMTALNLETDRWGMFCKEALCQAITLSPIHFLHNTASLCIGYSFRSNL